MSFQEFAFQERPVSEESVTAPKQVEPDIAVVSDDPLEAPIEEPAEDLTAIEVEPVKPHVEERSVFDVVSTDGDKGNVVADKSLGVAGKSNKSQPTALAHAADVEVVVAESLSQGDPLTDPEEILKAAKVKQNRRDSQSGPSDTSGGDAGEAGGSGAGGGADDGDAIAAQVRKLIADNPNIGPDRDNLELQHLLNRERVHGAAITTETYNKIKAQQASDKATLKSLQEKKAALPEYDPKRSTYHRAEAELKGLIAMYNPNGRDELNRLLAELGNAAAETEGAAAATDQAPAPDKGDAEEKSADGGKSEADADAIADQPVVAPDVGSEDGKDMGDRAERERLASMFVDEIKTWPEQYVVELKDGLEAGALDADDIQGIADRARAQNTLAAREAIAPVSAPAKEKSGIQPAEAEAAAQEEKDVLLKMAYNIEKGRTMEHDGADGARRADRARKAALLENPPDKDAVQVPTIQSDGEVVDLPVHKDIVAAVLPLDRWIDGREVPVDRRGVVKNPQEFKVQAEDAVAEGAWGQGKVSSLNVLYGRHRVVVVPQKRVLPSDVEITNPDELEGLVVGNKHVAVSRFVGPWGASGAVDGRCGDSSIIAGIDTLTNPNIAPLLLENSDVLDVDGLSSDDAANHAQEILAERLQFARVVSRYKEAETGGEPHRAELVAAISADARGSSARCEEAANQIEEALQLDGDLTPEQARHAAQAYQKEFRVALGRRKTVAEFESSEDLPGTIRDEVFEALRADMPHNQYMALQRTNSSLERDEVGRHILHMIRNGAMRMYSVPDSPPRTIYGPSAKSYLARAGNPDSDSSPDMLNDGSPQNVAADMVHSMFAGATSSDQYGARSQVRMTATWVNSMFAERASQHARENMDAPLDPRVVDPVIDQAEQLLTGESPSGVLRKAVGYDQDESITLPELYGRVVHAIAQVQDNAGVLAIPQPDRPHTAVTQGIHHTVDSSVSAIDPRQLARVTGLEPGKVAELPLRSQQVLAAIVGAKPTIEAPAVLLNMAEQKAKEARAYELAHIDETMLRHRAENLGVPVDNLDEGDIAVSRVVKDAIVASTPAAVDNRSGAAASSASLIFVAGPSGGGKGDQIKHGVIEASALRQTQGLGPVEFATVDGSSIVREGIVGRNLGAHILNARGRAAISEFGMLSPAQMQEAIWLQGTQQHMMLHLDEWLTAQAMQGKSARGGADVISAMDQSVAAALMVYTGQRGLSSRQRRDLISGGMMTPGGVLMAHGTLDAYGKDKVFSVPVFGNTVFAACGSFSDTNNIREPYTDFSTRIGFTPSNGNWYCPDITKQQLAPVLRFRVDQMNRALLAQTKVAAPEKVRRALVDGTSIHASHIRFIDGHPHQGRPLGSLSYGTPEQRKQVEDIVDKFAARNKYAQYRAAEDYKARIREAMGRNFSGYQASGALIVDRDNGVLTIGPKVFEDALLDS